MATSTFRNNPSASPVEAALQKAVLWVQTHREQFWAIFGTAAMGVALIVFVIRHRQMENEEAWIQLGPIQGQLMQGQTSQAAKGLQDWNNRFHGSSASTYAKFMKADLLYRTSDYATAAQAYSDLSQTGQPPETRPLALSAAASAEEMAGHLPQALTLTQ